MITVDEHYAGLDAMSADVRRMVESAYQRMLADIRGGASAQKAAEMAFNSFSGEYQEQLAAALSERMTTAIGVTELKDYQVSGGPLSRRLYAQAKATALSVANIVRENAKGWHDSRKLAIDLYEGYGFRQKETLPVRIPLPKYLRQAVGEEQDVFNAWAHSGSQQLRQILGDPITGPALSRELAKIRATALKTPALRAAYLQAITDLENGVGFDRISKALKTAWFERNRYFANRIAQTELHRAFTDTRAVEIMEDVEVQAVQIRMSSKHPKYDVCDLISKQDLYGLGPGVYPKDKAPKPGFHPFCRCVMASVFAIQKAVPRLRPGASREYLRSLDTQTAAQVMGSRKRLNAVLAGADPLDVWNDRSDPAYKVRLMGEVAKGKSVAAAPVATVQPPPSPKVPKFKTAKEASDWAVANNVADYADFTGVKPEVAEEWLQSIADHVHEFPALRANQKFTGTCQAQFARWWDIEVANTEMKLRTQHPGWAGDYRAWAETLVKKKKVPDNRFGHAWSQENVKGIAVNKTWGSAPMRFRDALARDVAGQGSPVGCDTIRSVADHEMGHQLDYLLGLDVDQNVVALYKEAKKQGIEQEVSEYAGTNIKEFIAECWAEARNNPSPRRFAQRIEAIVRSKYAAKFP